MKLVEFDNDELPPAPDDADDDTRRWKVLIVDDDDEVHRITRLVLRDVEFEGRSLRLIEARTGAEAADLLTRHADIAVALIDVVMESDDAGLNLVHRIRHEMANRSLRIILRTGYPMAAPQRKIVVDYDINDYRSKAALSSQDLFTCLITALRGYRDIRALECERLRWQRLAEAASAFIKASTVSGFATVVMDELGHLLSVGGTPGVAVRYECAVVSEDDSRIAPGGMVLAGCGDMSGIVGRNFAKARPALAGHAQAIRSYGVKDGIILLRLGVPAEPSDSLLIVADVGHSPDLLSERPMLEFFRLKAGEALAQIVWRNRENLKYQSTLARLNRIAMPAESGTPRLSERV